MSAATPGNALSGARRARASWPRRLVARAAARDLRAFVVPGPDVARAHGLDLAAAGLPLADTPRHASVLVLVGELPAGLKRAAAVAYAQMPRPRAILGVGAGDVSPLPGPDASAGMGQGTLEEAVAGLRRSFAEGAFSPEAPGFDVDEIRTRTEYVCPMHPEVVSDEPGSCPRCGMDLVPRESAGGMDHSGHDRAGHEGVDHGRKEHDQANQEHPGHDHAGHGTMDHSGHGGHDDADREVTDRGGSGGHGEGRAAHEEPGAGYACPMHPEVRSAEPGSCSICGMDLVPRERAGGTEHVGAGEEERGVHGHEGMGADEAPAGTATEYTCPMHPEVSRDEPGSCPVCGMDLVPREEDAATAGHEAHGHAEMRHGSHEEHGSRGGDGDEDPGEIDHADGSEGQEHHGDAAHGGHEGMDHGGHGGHGGHGHMDHGDMSFMSMVEMTRDLPRSSDGLQMERVEAPFGPLFPGLPGGLSLKLTLDGDTVAGAEAGGVGGRILEDLAGPAETLVDRLSGLDPLSPVAYRLLAIRTVEEAAGIPVSEQTALARAGALERERAASHLNWLAGFAHLLGYAWLEACAARLQMALLRASGAEEAARLRPEVVKLARRVERTPLLGRKLRRLGRVPGEDEALGPVARAGGTPTDARTEEWIYRAVLGFEPVVREGNDALSRLLVRLEEAERSLELVRRAGQVSIPALELDGAYGAGVGAAKVETPRGAATLRVTLEGGAVSNAELETPSTAHLGLVERVVEGEELANALIGVASLDISPWGVTR